MYDYRTKYRRQLLLAVKNNKSESQKERYSSPRHPSPSRNLAGPPDSERSSQLSLFCSLMMNCRTAANIRPFPRAREQDSSARNSFQCSSSSRPVRAATTRESARSSRSESLCHTPVVESTRGTNLPPTRATPGPCLATFFLKASLSRVAILFSRLLSVRPPVMTSSVKQFTTVTS